MKMQVFLFTKKFFTKQKIKKGITTRILFNCKTPSSIFDKRSAKNKKYKVNPDH